MRLVVAHPGASMSTADVHNGLVSALKRRGHEVYEYALHGRVQTSYHYLQYAWKHGGKVADRPNAADAIYHASEPLIARSLRAQPDVVLVVSGMYLHPDVFLLMKRAGLKVAVLFTESPYDDEQQAKILPFVDWAWTNERAWARDVGIGYLPHACDATIHQPDVIPSSTLPAHDVVFVGTGFQERIDLLSDVDWSGLNFGLYGSWDLLGSRNALRKHICGGYLDNARETSLLYRKAKIGLNLYRTSKGFGKDAPRVTHAESLNPRAYELAATGCFTISDDRPEVAEVFGDLVPTFTNATELRALIDRWLSDEAGRGRIQDQLRTVVKAQTWDIRAEIVERDLLAHGVVTPRQAPDVRAGAWLDREPQRQRALAVG